MKTSILAVLGLSGGELLLLLLAVVFLAFLAVAGGVAALLIARSLNKRAQTSAIPKAGPPAVEPVPAASAPSLAGSQFHCANLTGADFNDVNLSNARFHNVDLSNVTITAAQMGGAAFKHIGPPPDADGRQERQRPVRFEEMMLCDSTFRQVDLSNVRIVDCNLSGMTINGLLVTDLLASYQEHRLTGD